MTVKQVDEKVEKLREEFQIFRGAVETGLTSGEMASRAGKTLSKALQPLTKNIDGIANVTISLEERVEALENKQSWWKQLWQKIKNLKG